MKFDDNIRIFNELSETNPEIVNIQGLNEEKIDN